MTTSTKVDRLRLQLSHSIPFSSSSTLLHHTPLHHTHLPILFNIQKNTIFSNLQNILYIHYHCLLPTTIVFYPLPLSSTHYHCLLPTTIVFYPLPLSPTNTYNSYTPTSHPHLP